MTLGYLCWICGVNEQQESSPYCMTCETSLDTAPDQHPDGDDRPLPLEDEYGTLDADWGKLGEKLAGDWDEELFND